MYSKLVYQAVKALNNAARLLDRLTIRWVKAHVDKSKEHRGNFPADKTAKEGALALDTKSLVHPDDLPLPSLQTQKAKIYAYFVKEWNRRWENNVHQPECRQTKQWFPTINTRRSFQLISGRSRYKYTILMHAITGHNHLAYHEHKQKNLPSPTCTVCNQPGSKMTTEHLFTECEALGTLRLHHVRNACTSVITIHHVNKPFRYIYTHNRGDHRMAPLRLEAKRG